MMQVNIDDIECNLGKYLNRIESGEKLIITRDGKPVYELKNIEHKEGEPRPYGLCKGEFHVPDDFDEPLPDNILQEFEGK